MADNSTLPADGDKIRDIDRAGVKTQVMVLDIGGQAAESLLTVANPMPVAVSALPLPAGAATAAGQADIVAAINANGGGGGGGGGGSVTVTNFPATQPVSAASLPLPSGAATAAGVASVVTALGSPLQAGGTVSVSGTVPVSGTFFQATQPVSAASLPLPTNASQDRTTAAAPGAVRLTDGASFYDSRAIRALTVADQVTLGGLTFPVSTSNSTAAQLAAGATFTGAVETIQNQQAAQIQVICDQPYTLVILQYADAGGTRLTSADTFVQAAGSTYAANVTLPGNFFRLTVTNNGSQPTTTLLVDVTFGIMATGPRTVTQAGNNRSAINEVAGVALTAGQALPVAGTVALDATTLANLDNLASNSDVPDFVAITGDPNGDFAGIDLMSAFFDDAQGLAARVKVINPPRADITGAQMASDAPTPIVVNGSVGLNYVIDTQGYQSLNFTSQTIAASVTASDDSLTWTALTGAPRVLGALTTSITAGAGFSFPCVARYIRLSVTTAGYGVAYLRAAPWNGAYTTAAGANIAQLAGTAPVTAGVAGTLAVGGNIANGVAPTANPVLVAGIDGGGLTRRVLTDTVGAVAVGGVDTAGTARRVLTDTAGRTQAVALGLTGLATQTQLGLLSADFNAVPKLAVAESTMVEGNTQVDLLAKILIELRVLNFQMNQLPYVLNGGPQFALDDPEALRADPAFSIN